MGRTLPTVTHDDVNAAFEDGSYLKENDDRLLAYLDVLCSTVIRSDTVRLLANNRCITLNAVLTNASWSDRTGPRPSWPGSSSFSPSWPDARRPQGVTTRPAVSICPSAKVSPSTCPPCIPRPPTRPARSRPWSDDRSPWFRWT